MNNNLILTGFSGTGKSEVGLMIAQLWGWNFVDTDHQITVTAGKSISEIFEEDGEAHFRHLERLSVAAACNTSRAVISTGGGAIVDPDNYRTMAASGTIICLDATPDTIDKRIQQLNNSLKKKDLRPLLADTNQVRRIKDLKTQRQTYYDLAESTIHTDGLSVQEVAQEVYERWNKIAQLGTRDGAASKLLPDFVVETTSASSPVFIGWGLLDHIGKCLLGIGIRGPVYIITEPSLSDLYGQQIQRAFEATGIEAHTFTVPPGEESKSLNVAERIYEWLAERRCERGHAIIGMGGGMICDLAGFVAATFLRGIPVIQVPTSLAAMVDASIGGKTAVNLPAGKNLVGAFYQPRLIMADLDTLRTLHTREIAAGWAEAIKHGLILDASLFNLFEENVKALLSLEPTITEELIRRSMSIKAKVVEEDERETTGKRTLLNYGHTIGHGLEAATKYTELLHGEAVSIGMVGAATIGCKIGILPKEATERHTSILERFGLPTSCPIADPDSVLSAIELDKKATSKLINWVLLQEIGRATIRSDISRELVKQTVEDLCR